MAPVVVGVLMLTMFEYLRSNVMIGVAAVIVLSSLVRYWCSRRVVEIGEEGKINLPPLQGVIDLFLISNWVSGLAWGLFSVLIFDNQGGVVPVVMVAVLLCGVTAGYMTGKYYFFPVLVMQIFALWLPVLVYGLMVVVGYIASPISQEPIPPAALLILVVFVAVMLRLGRDLETKYWRAQLDRFFLQQNRECLQDSRNRFDRLINLTHTGLITVDESKCLLSANQP